MAPDALTDGGIIVAIAGIAYASTRLRLSTWAAVLSLLACVIHAMVLPDHWAEMQQHGIFMLCAVVGQGLGVLLLPTERRWALAATIYGNLLIVAIAVWAYGWGMPTWLYGDGREALNWQVLVCTLAELGIVGCCVGALMRVSDPKANRCRSAPRG